ncbi:MAG: FG-GAP-like repeat-containing protein [Planctomycetota bacterium]|nr:FG-GAP-like repeat-containing protein [Planctomycetota bacterium]
MVRCLLLILALVISPALSAQGPCALPGDGNFVASDQALGILTSNSVVLGDIDGDDDLDLVTGEISTNHIYLNDGAGNFTDSGQDLGSSWTRAVALADFDGDGDLDLASANGISGTISAANTIAFNDGNGNFTDSGQSLGDSPSNCLAVGDLDGDGDLDIVVGNGDNLVGLTANRVYTNDGNGNFTDSGQMLGSTVTLALALGDLDGDGDLDFIEGGIVGPNPTQIFINDGNGSFSASASMLPEPPHVTGLSIGDLDGDGDLDIAASTSSVGGVADGTRIWFNDSSGTFNDSGQLLGEGSYGQTIGDIDDDGDLDLVEMQSPFDVAGIHRNDGSGVFTENDRSFEPGDSISLALGDLDADGDLDLVAAILGGPDRIYFNEYQGPDCDEDGVPDLCQLDPTTDQNGDGILDSCQGFIRGECNGDDAIDIADGTFLLNFLFVNGATPTCIKTCDVNDDSTVNLADAVALLGYLFSNAPPPPPPFPDCGIDPTDDNLDCSSAAACP